MSSTAEFLNGVSGIYAIIHRDNGMIYVGSSVNLAVRRYSHVGCALRGSPARIHRAIREFGAAAFDFEVLERCPKALLLEREQFYIDLLGAALPENLNVKTIANAVYDISPSESTRERQRLAKLGKPLTQEHRQALRDAPRRSKKTLTPEHRAKLSEAHKTSPKCKAWMDKMHASRRGTKQTPEHIARKSEGMKGHRVSEECRAKISAAHKGRKCNDQNRANMRAGWVAWRIRNNKPPLKTK